MHISIICGEASGDMHAANLVKELKALKPGIRFSAVGGSMLAAEGVEIYYDIRNLSVIGFFDVLKKLPKFLALKKRILGKLLDEKPEYIIMVDFSGFNLRLAKALDNAIPIIYYVSPQIWASRQGRVRTIKRYIRKMLVFFKFEEELYRRHGIDAYCVGHPLLDVVKSTLPKNEFLHSLGLSDLKTTVALLPGSREQEIRYILPLLLKASSLIKNKIPQAQFVIAKSGVVDDALYRGIMRTYPTEAKIIEGKTYDCLSSADLALVASGTATLETAILQTPLIIVYTLNTLNYLVYRPMVKLPFIGLVNIVAGKKIVPEFIQFRARPKLVADEAIRLLTHPEELKKTKENLARIIPLLGEKGASKRAAKNILDYIQKA